MVLVRHPINCFNLACCACDSFARIATLIADDSVGCVECRFKNLGKRLAGRFGVWALVPLDGQELQCGFSLPPSVCHHSHGAVVDPDHFFNTLEAGNGPCIEAFEFAPEHRAILDGRIQHAGQRQIDAVHLGAGGFVDGVEPSQPLAGEFPVLRVLQADGRGLCQLACRCGDLAKGGGAPAGHVGDDAVGCPAVGCRHLPFISSGLHQHHAGNGTTLAYIVLRLPDATAATGAEISPDPVARQVLARCRVLGSDFGPVTVQFFCHQLCQTGQGALAHFGASNPDHDAVIRTHHHPGVHLCGLAALCGGLHRPGRRYGNHQA